MPLKTAILDFGFVFIEQSFLEIYIRDASLSPTFHIYICRSISNNNKGLIFYNSVKFIEMSGPFVFLIYLN